MSALEGTISPLLRRNLNESDIGELCEVIVSSAPHVVISHIPANTFLETRRYFGRHGCFLFEG